MQGEEMQVGAPGPTAGGSAAHTSLLPLPCSRQVKNGTFCTRTPGIGKREDTGGQRRGGVVGVGGMKAARSQQRGRGEQRKFSLGKIGKGLVGGWDTPGCKAHKPPLPPRDLAPKGRLRAVRTEVKGDAGTMRPARQVRSALPPTPSAPQISRAGCKGQGRASAPGPPPPGIK